MLKKTCVNLITFLIVIHYSNSIFCQGVGINSNGNPADSSAMLDVSSDNSGILIPRMTTVNRNSINNPAAGLMIYNTDNKCLEIFEYNVWQSLACAHCPLPANANNITGTSAVCAGDVNVSYSVPSINGATSYLWQYSGSGVSINGNSESINLDFSTFATSGNLSVLGVNNCGNGNMSPAFAINVNVAPSTPTAGSHIASQNQITWNWNIVLGATGYKYNTTNDYNTATDNGVATSYTQTSLLPQTSYTLYVWAYNNCGVSNFLLLTQQTSGGNKIIFKTSTTYNANLGGVAGADSKCQARANAAGLTGTYKAWISTSSSSPATTFTKYSSPYILTDGTQIASNWNDLTDGSIPNVTGGNYPNIHLDEFGNVLPFTPGGGYSGCGSWLGGYFIFSWNATNADGTFKPAPIGQYSNCHTTCNDWTSTSGGGDVWIMWNNSNTLDCSAATHLICVEQ